MIGHGIVSAGLFFIIGGLYRKHGTRLLTYYGGLVTKMPLFSLYLFIFCLANVATPGSCNFIGELMVFVSIMEKNFFSFLLTATSVVLSVVYTMLLFNRIIFGNFKINYISNWTDIDKKENFVYGLLVILTIFFGICPNYICDYTFITVLNITEILKFKLLFSF